MPSPSRDLRVQPREGSDVDGDSKIGGRDGEGDDEGKWEGA